MRVAILFDDVDAIMLLDEFVDLAGERIGAQAEIVGLDRVFVAKLIAALGYAPMGSAVGDDSDFRIRPFENFWTRNEGARGFKLAVEALHVVFVIVGALAVIGFVVVSAAASEVGSGGMLGAGQSAVADAVAIEISVAGEAAEFGEGIFVENFAALDGDGWIFEGIGHPVVHAKIEIGHDEDERLKLLGEIESFRSHAETLCNRRRNQHDLFRIAVRKKSGSENVSLRSARRQAG